MAPRDFSLTFTVLRTWWRFGYGVPNRTLLTAAGWRRLFWRFWWLSLREEREYLEGVARYWNVTPLSTDTNEQLRERCKRAAWMRPLP